MVQLQLRDFNKIVSLLNKRPQFKSGEKLERFFAGLDFKFPDTISEFYKNYDGAEGFIGQNIWINILPTESLNDRNIFYRMSLFLKDYFLFAIDQNQVGYAINKLTAEIYDLDDLNFLQKNIPRYSAKDFQGFMLYLFDKRLLLAKID